MALVRDLQRRKKKWSATTFSEQLIDLSHTRLITDIEALYIVQAMREQKSAEDCGALLSTLVEPYIFVSSNVISILLSTRCSKLRLALLSRLVPRLQDPDARMGDILTLFPHFGMKRQAESMLLQKASAIAMSKQLKVSSLKRQPVIPPLVLSSILLTSDKSDAPTNAPEPAIRELHTTKTKNRLSQHRTSLAPVMRNSGTMSRTTTMTRRIARGSSVGQNAPPTTVASVATTASLIAKTKKRVSIAHRRHISTEIYDEQSKTATPMNHPEHIAHMEREIADMSHLQRNLNESSKEMSRHIASISRFQKKRKKEKIIVI